MDIFGDAHISNSLITNKKIENISSGILDMSANFFTLDYSSGTTFNISNEDARTYISQPFTLRLENFLPEYSENNIINIKIMIDVSGNVNKGFCNLLELSTGPTDAGIQHVPIILNGSSSLNLSKSQIIIQYINIINIAGNIKIITNINLYAKSNDSILNSIELTPYERTIDSLTISFPIAFNENTPADTYSINVVPPGDNVFPASFAASTPTYTINNLQSDELYTIDISFNNVYGNRIISNSLGYYTLIPPITDLTSVANTDTTIDISFNAPISGTVDYYEVTTNPLPIDNSGVPIRFELPLTTYTISDLQSDTSYNISVVARNNSNNTSAPVSTAYYTLLSAPSNLIGTGRTSSSIDISFNAPSGIVVDYLATATPANGIDVSNVSLVTTTTISDLESDTSYNIYVIARNSNGNSAPSAAIEYYTLILPITDLKGVNSTSTTIDISFNAPITGRVDYYEVTTDPLPISGNVPIRFDLPLTTYTIINLQSNTLYNIFVIARNNVNNSSSTVSIPYYTTLSPPNSVIATRSSSFTIDISFNPPISGTVSYKVYASPSPSGIDISYNFDTSGNTYQLTGLQSNTLYNIYVVAVNSNGDSSPSNTASRSTTLLPPTSLIATRSDSSSIDISFNAPSGIVVDYLATAQPASGVSVSKVFTGTTSTISSLQSNMLYNIFVVARNSNGDSSPSNTASRSTTLLPPTNLITTGKTAYTISISFTPPSGTVNSYTVYAQPKPSGTIISQTFSAPSSTYTITSLSLGTEYTIYMTATNTLGTSSNSNSIDVTTALSTVTPTLILENSGYYSVYTFTSNGTITIPTTTTQTIYYLVVAGGGSGGRCGNQGGGGGGGGGVLQGSSTINTRDTITVNVGAGGTIGSSGILLNGLNGENSSIIFTTNTSNNKISIGGGRGGDFPQVGGSGGGGGQISTTGALGTSGQGFDGVSGSSYNRSGGGGGAGGSYGPEQSDGRYGVMCTQPGIRTLYQMVYWGGGGGGGNNRYNGGSGGLGGGGGGSSQENNFGNGGGSALNSGSNGIIKNLIGLNRFTTLLGGNGGTNTGGGGGGAVQTFSGGNGGSGIVVIAIQNVMVVDSSLPPPTNLTTPSSTATAISIAFDAPHSIVVDLYKVAVIANNVLITTQSILASATTYTISDLTPNTTYTIQLASIIGNKSSLNTTTSKSTNNHIINSMSNSTSIVVAYGFRRYSSSYTQATVNIRNGTTNATSDFFTSDIHGLATSINDTGTSLSSWLNGATGFITKWYDQSGRNKHLTPSGTHLQPTIGKNANGYYVYFNNQQLSTSNIFVTTSVTNGHIIFASQEVTRVENVLIRFNGVNTNLSYIHSPWSDGSWYFMIGDYAPADRAQSSANPVAVGSRGVFSGFKSSVSNKNGLRINGGTRFLTVRSGVGNVSGGLVIGTAPSLKSNHYVYGFIVCNTQLGIADETLLESNI